MKECIFVVFLKVILIVKKLKVFKFGGVFFKDVEVMKYVVIIFWGYIND